jgi:diacylglycerol kinase family enzyme
MSERPSKPPLATDASWSSAADRVAVVVNGRARHVTAEVVELLDQIVHSGDLYVSRSLEEARDIARIIIERGYPTVLTGGGDGTFVQTVSFVVRTAEELGRPLPRFGLLRLGTGNALAWVLGSKRERGRGVIADLARLRREGGSRSLRLIEVEDMLTPFGGIGADATTLQHHGATRAAFQKHRALRLLDRGPITYATAILGRSVPQYLLGSRLQVRVVNEGEPAIRIGRDGRPIGAEIAKGEVIYEGSARVLAFGTIPYWGFGARVFPHAEDREDRFSLRVVNFGSVEAMVHLRDIWRGSYRSDRLHDFLVERVAIHTDQPTALQLGGEVVGERDVIHAALSKRDIRVVDYYAPPPV